MKSIEARGGSALKRVAVFVLRPFRRLLGRMLQFVEQDELRALRHETARLSSASVESVTYLGSELRNLDERLSRVEEDLAAVRRLLEASGSDAEPGSERASTPAAPSA
jgi:hypothetical protein